MLSPAESTDGRIYKRLVAWSSCQDRVHVRNSSGTNQHEPMHRCSLGDHSATTPTQSSSAANHFDRSSYFNYLVLLEVSGN